MKRSARTFDLAIIVAATARVGAGAATPVNPDTPARSCAIVEQKKSISDFELSFFLPQSRQPQPGEPLCAHCAAYSRADAPVPPPTRRR